MKDKIKQIIIDFVEQYPKQNNITTKWETPLVNFVSASNENVLSMKDNVYFEHYLPTDILSNAKTIIVYFIPYNKEIAESNINVKDDYASLEWATAYYDTNNMMLELNKYLIEVLSKLNIKADYCHDALPISNEIHYSRWSHRHLGYYAGIGTFGLNNMLITEKGCCGRYNSLVIDYVVEPDNIIETEYCLYKKNGSCQVCVNNCIFGALNKDHFNRVICNEQCVRNEIRYGEHRSCCGKCVVNLPCSFKRL